jgi:hypothetical protein
MFQCLGESLRIAECMPGGSLELVFIGHHG